MSDHNNTGWSWSYSRMFGIMYGPIPVGIIVVVIGVLVYTVFFAQ